MVKLPYGSFTFPINDSEIVLIAGGTGITPFISLLEYANDKKLNLKINLYYGIKSQEYLIFSSLLNECKRSLSNFKCHIFIEDRSNINTLFNVSKGQLSIQTILTDTIGNKNSIYYFSGPQKMISSFRNEFMLNNIQESKIIIDKWE